jgi:tetratricopeptide (TPR) repeat protein
MEAVERGDLHPDVLRELEWSHLMHLCPTCRAGARAWLERVHDQPAKSGAAFQALPFVLARHAVDEKEKAAQAERDLRDLLQLPQEERLATIDRARRRFRGILLAHRLLNEARRHIPEDPQEVHDLGEAAEKVLLRTPSSPGYFDALTRATAYRANALRAGGKLREAAERMACARSFIRHEHVTELLVYAEVDWLEGVLRKDERRFQEAERLLVRSAALFNLAGEHIEASRPLMALGLAYYDQQHLAKAIATTRLALAFLGPESEPRLYLCGRHNLALFYVESGRYEAAAALLAADEALYQEFPDRWTTLRKLWLGGKIALRTGGLSEAETAFLQVRSGFLHQGIGYDAAMVSLDLALVYLQQCRTAELKALAEEMHAVFASEDVHREAVAALLLFQNAVRREAVTSELVEEISTYLRRARGNPAMRFQAREDETR